MKTIGFIGLGIMGKPMARNLIKAGYGLIVHDVNSAPVPELVGAGAKEAASPAEVAAGADIVITMLPNSPDVKAVVLGDRGVLTGAPPGLIVVDMGYIAPAVSREMAEKAAAKSVRMLDAPVSGGEPKARDGTLSNGLGWRIRQRPDDQVGQSDCGRTEYRRHVGGAGASRQVGC